jgi:hypothetical protein
VRNPDGNEFEANARTLEAATAREAADAAQLRADVEFVDERALTPLETSGSPLSDSVAAPTTPDGKETGAAADALVAHDGTDALSDDVLGAQTAGPIEDAPGGEDVTASAFDSTGTTTLTPAPEAAAGHMVGLDAPAQIASVGDARDDVAANVTFDGADAVATVDAGLASDAGGVTTDE